MNNPFDKESLSQREKDLLADGGWQCSFCATVNASYITTCACSHNRDDSYENLHGRYVPRDDEEWTEAGITVDGPAVEMDSVSETVTTPAEPEFHVASAVPSPEPVSVIEPVFHAESTISAENIPVSASADTVPAANAAAAPAGIVSTTDTATAAADAAPKSAVSNTNKPMEEYSEYEQGILKDGGWECVFCSRINASYITTCACGHSNEDSYLMRRGRYVDPNGDQLPEHTPEPVETVETAPAFEPQESPEETGEAMIAQIEESLERDSSDVAKIRAIRKFKDLVKKGYMTEEEYNRKKEELLSFDEDELSVGSPEPAAPAEDHHDEGDA